MIGGGPDGRSCGGQELPGTACEEIAWGRIGAELLCCTLARGLPSERRGQGGGGIAPAGKAHDRPQMDEHPGVSPDVTSER